MTGIYQITNKINNRSYIGQSKNIQRRFNDHIKGWSSSHKLQEDISKYGLENFEFEVLEECDPSELLDKERSYIPQKQPYYNIVDKGDGEFNTLISEGTKKWWNNLDQDIKNQIITKNLKGPPKGHSVSRETRAKISKKISENQGKRVMIVETGQVFEKVKYLEEYLGASPGTYAKYKKGKIKTVKGYHVVEV